jgi:hypothetical protein
MRRIERKIDDILERTSVDLQEEMELEMQVDCRE